MSVDVVIYSLLNSISVFYLTKLQMHQSRDLSLLTLITNLKQNMPYFVKSVRQLCLFLS